MIDTPPLLLKLAATVIGGLCFIAAIAWIEEMLK